MKVLVIRFSSIGDIVLTTPVVRCLKKQLPDVEIHYLVKKKFATVLEGNPYIHKLHTLDEDLAPLITNLKAEQFDLIIDLHKNLRSLKVKRALRPSRSVSFQKLNVQKWILTALKINLLPKVHIVDRCLDTVRSLGIHNDGAGLDYFIPKQDVVPDDDIPAAQSFGFVGVVIGAAHNTKKLPVEKIRQLCSYINHPIILLGGPEDRANGDVIAATDPIKIYNSCGKFSLNESADLVRRAKLIITHDTGLMHIAAAFKKPVISIWGNTVPSFGMYPYYGESMVGNAMFEVKNLWCRPCSKIGYKKCPLGHFNCMNHQDIDAIARRAESIFR